MRKITILIFLISMTIYGQESMKKIELEEGVNSIKYNGLEIETLLQIYDEKSPDHLIGDVRLELSANGKTIADFYTANDKSVVEYNTKIYKNYFLTFLIENNKKYLIIEDAKLGKAFALLSRRSALVDNMVAIEIISSVAEFGYDGPIEDENRNYFTDVQYTLKVTVKDVVKTISFYSSEIKSGFMIDINGYEVRILSDIYKNSYVILEMIIDKKEGK